MKMQVEVSIFKVGGPGGAWLVEVRSEDADYHLAATTLKAAKRQARALLNEHYALNVKQLRLDQHADYQYYTTTYEIEISDIEY